jgi:outer membrane lipoprotein-sorting protein
MHRYTLVIVLALFFPLYVYGCAPRPKGIVTQAGVDADRLLASLQQREADLKTFRGVGRFKTIRGTDVRVFRVVWIGSKPHNLRVETLGPWGQPTMTFVLNGSNFFLHSRRDNHYFRGDATASNLSRFASIPVKGEDLFKLLSGQPPILPFHYGKIRTASADGRWILNLYERWGRLVEKVWLDDAATTVEKVEVFDKWGNLHYRIAFSDFHQTESFLLPYRIAISDPERLVCSLMVEQFWTNVSIPDGAYTIEVSGARETDPNS